jgi:hypothetical protein
MFIMIKGVSIQWYGMYQLLGKLSKFVNVGIPVALEHFCSSVVCSVTSVYVQGTSDQTV